MPYEIRKNGKRYEVYNPDTGKVYGRHSSRAKARKQQAALYAVAPPDKEDK